MTQDFALLRRLYNVFDPFRPLPAGDPAYVDCREVRGEGDILVEIGREILFSDRMTCQLYAGHRGAGKSTESGITKLAVMPYKVILSRQ
ncbi:hypothetical protein PCC6912_55660 [Chlorogloeopsis fritschii PCC 6912]|uniref:ATP-binding protein n=1 Tax=Chlorogloeopsis fritschii PCC 6912 TaxID=211165 RepID=A0A3S0ZVZ8_CHLFR|nr:hypothetical protein PCC6912_55660 [Chlorogloeopsis fritschii PCC 6912]